MQHCIPTDDTIGNKRSFESPLSKKYLLFLETFLLGGALLMPWACRPVQRNLPLALPRLTITNFLVREEGSSWK